MLTIAYAIPSSSPFSHITPKTDGVDAYIQHAVRNDIDYFGFLK
jgi:hypothetical protein